MTQPTGHRREIWSSLCIGYDAVSGPTVHRFIHRIGELYTDCPESRDR